MFYLHVFDLQKFQERRYFHTWNRDHRWGFTVTYWYFSGRTHRWVWWCSSRRHEPISVPECSLVISILVYLWPQFISTPKKSQLHADANTKRKTMRAFSGLPNNRTGKKCGFLYVKPYFYIYIYMYSCIHTNMCLVFLFT